MSLDIYTGATIALNRWSTAATWKAWRTRLATNFGIAATEANLSRASKASGGRVGAAVGTAKCTTEHQLVFINGVVISHDLFDVVII